MDHEQGSQLRGSIPRLSRLPMPRASHDNLRQTRASHAVPVPHKDPSKTSTLPRPGAGHASQTPALTPLAENLNRSLRSRYAWTNNSSRDRSNTSPVRDALHAANQTSMDTTPPGANAGGPVFESGDENPTADGEATTKESSVDVGTVVREKRRPRPSLSERTMETLSRISPSPSPTRRRSSMFSAESTMGPPTRPASSLRTHRPTTPSAARSPSPTKQPFRPPGKLLSTKAVPPVPPLPVMGHIYTPPRAFMRDAGLRIAKPSRNTRTSVSSAVTEDDLHRPPSIEPPTSQLRSQTVRLKPTYSGSTISSKSPMIKSSANSALGNSASAQGSKRSDSSVLETNAGSLRPMSRGEKPLASTTPKRSAPKPTTKPKASTTPKREPATNDTLDQDPNKISTPSTTLRETIAKAKAARKTARDHPIEAGAAVDGEHTEVKASLSQRIRAALLSGSLNIAAANLKEIPSEVLKMYESGAHATWSEVVDLVKFNAADNEISEIPSDVFPDWTVEELQADDEKSNQFGGLEVLDLHGNTISMLPIGFRRLERVRYLNLSSNRLDGQALEVVRQMRGLQDLYLANNLLCGMLAPRISESVLLQVLDLHDNGLEQLPESIAQLTSLRKLDLAGNKLSELPVSALATLPLVELNVSRNRLGATLLSQQSIIFPKLRVLNVSQNSLLDIGGDDASFPSLQSLSVDTNRLSTLPHLSGSREMLTITASGNLLTEMPPNFARLTSLKSADFSANNIRAVDSSLAKMDNLVMLNLAGNPLRERKYLTMNATDIRQDLTRRNATADPGNGEGESSTCSGRSHTASSTETGSPATGTINGLIKPMNGILDLSSRNLAVVNLDMIDMTATSGIHTIRLSNNDLTSFPTALLSHDCVKDTLRSLDLSHNPLLHSIAYLTNDLELPRLTSLYVVSTGLSSLDALTTHLSAPQLQELNISCHRLTGHVPRVREYYPSLRTLLATDNWFNSIEVEAVHGLEVLDVRNNEIVALPPKIGEFGNHHGRQEAGRLRNFEASGNKFRVPRLAVLERGTEAVLRDLRRMVPENQVGEDWQGDN